MSSIIALVMFAYGLIFGSFINALVWRMRQQLDDDGNPKKLSNKKQKDVSIVKGRSMCPQCKHTLAVSDLIPFFSWIALRGKCRYCKAPISTQYPIVELLTAFVFAISYISWPYNLVGAEWILFIAYLVTVICLIALAIYDLKWFILPSKLIYISVVVYAIGLIIFSLVVDDYYRMGMSFVAAMLFFGLFLGIYILSALAKKSGKSNSDWLGFGDVRLAFLLGLLLGQPILVFLAMFIASIIGIITIAPSLVQKRITLTSKVPFGPFLIMGTLITVLYGDRIVNWYTSIILGL